MDDERLRALKGYGVLDTPAEPRFDRITALAADLFEAPIALVSLLDECRQWFKSHHGLDERETPREWAFCEHAVRRPAGGVFVVPDATDDPAFRENPLVTGAPFIRFYAGAPLVTAQGHALGTLCVIDTRPRTSFTEADARRLQRLATLAMDELEMGREARAAAERQQLLGLAEEMAGVGHWRLAADGAVRWSPQVYRIHGVDPASFDPNFDDNVAFYHPDDRAAVIAFCERAFERQEDFAFQLRLTRADGALRHVVCKARCEVDVQGRTAAITGVFQDVTDQVRALDELKRSERRYRLIAENMGDVVTRIRLDGSSSYISPGIERLIGRTPEEMRGRPAQAFVHEADRPMVLATLREMAGGLRRKALVHRATHKDGRDVWVETHFRLVRADGPHAPEIVAVIRDVSERRAAQEALQRSEARYRLLADGANDLVTEMDVEGCFSYVSPSVFTIAGYDASEVVGRRALDFIHPDDRDRVRTKFREALKGPSGWQIEYRLLRKDGRTIWVEARPTLVRDPVTGQSVGVTDVIRDVTVRHELEAELIRARESAEAAARVKADFLANMSHELRTPLSGVVGFSGLIAEAPELLPETRRRAELVRTASRSLVTIVNDVLDFSKIEAEGVALDLQPVDLEEVLDHAAALVRDDAERKGLALEVQVSRLFAPVLADASRLRQVVLNLLGNAVKFTAAGRVSLSLSETADGRLRIAVRDTGVGIPADRLDAIFDRFAQADGSTSRRFGGTGLGLAISRSIVQAMGGEMGVQSTPGVGSTFWFAFAPALADVMPAARAAEAFVPRVAGTRVLLADDNEVNRDLFAAMLAGRGLDITLAADGAEAVAACEATRFDLVFMDVQMPGVDGLQATRMLRERGFDLPVVALTANVLHDQVEGYRRAGMNDHLAKPYEPADVLRMIARWAPQAAGRTADGAAPVVSSATLGALEASLGTSALDGFLGRLAEQLRTMADALVEPGSPEALGTRAHSVRGLAGTLGFGEIARSYAELEAACRKGDAPPPLEDARAATRAALAAIADRRAA